ncbi:putative membrane protein YuiD [Morella rubra]|uniref:Putative membrane protein YuiD n=1 Tax=Morella rubra TaxID=262757 RepID=A0A6A1VLZ5_9ROSI|nr:putative membrane protein YuiD [Morella rubra]
MLLQCCCWSFTGRSWASTHSSLSSPKHHNLIGHSRKEPLLLFLPLRVRQSKSSSLKLTCLGAELFDQISQLAHNKVLLAAGVSAAIGQLSKPFTSVLLYGKDFDFRATVQAGGFPSTHSSAVVATATTIGLERGLSDSIFGLTVVYAGLVMYDAQGVRREVGNHSKVLNKVLAKIDSVPTKDRDDVIYSKPGTPLSLSLESFGPPLSREARSFKPKPTNSPLLLRSDDKIGQTSQAVLSTGLTDVEEERTTGSLIPLKESIGHTEVEVIAGALLGFFVSLAVYAIM